MEIVRHLHSKSSLALVKGYCFKNLREGGADQEEDHDGSPGRNTSQKGPTVLLSVIWSFRSFDIYQNNNADASIFNVYRSNDGDM